MGLRRAPPPGLVQGQARGGALTCRRRRPARVHGRRDLFTFRGLTFLELVLQGRDFPANVKDVVFVECLELLYQESQIPYLRK